MANIDEPSSDGLQEYRVEVDVTFYGTFRLQATSPDEAKSIVLSGMRPEEDQWESVAGLEVYKDEDDEDLAEPVLTESEIKILPWWITW